MIQIGNLKLSLSDDEKKLYSRAARALGISPKEIRELQIIKKAVDAREKTNVHFVFSVEVAVSGDEKKIVSRLKKEFRKYS